MWFPLGVAEVAVRWAVALGEGTVDQGDGMKECSGDEAAVELVQLLLGQHQAVSLS